MKHLTKSVAFLALAALCTPAIQAKTAATDSLVNNYMRSSIYTVLVSSKSRMPAMRKKQRMPTMQPTPI